MYDSLMLRNKDEHTWLDPHFVPEGRYDNSPAIYHWDSRGHRFEIRRLDAEILLLAQFTQRQAAALESGVKPPHSKISI